MPTHVVLLDSHPLPAPLSGHAALDFCNTLAGWNGGGHREYLAGYDELAVWAGFAGLLTPERVRALRRRAAAEPDVARSVLDRARDARGRLYELLTGPGGPARLAPVSADMAAATAHLRLVGGAGGGFGWEIAAASGLAAPLHAVLWAAGQLLVSPDVQRVRACPGDGCGWLFLDRSGRRRWCTMATCGNRAKARRFADRHRSSTDK